MKGIVGTQSAPDKLTCEELNKIFFTSSDGCAENRMAPIFGSLANDNDPDFIAMSELLNSAAKAGVEWIPYFSARESY